MKKKFINYFSRIAEETAQLSSARRLKVGCIIVKNGRILSIGYNGTPAGWDNNCENEFTTHPENLTKLVTKVEVSHAEENCLMKMATSTESSDGATMFITHPPCINCAKLINLAGIKKVYYNEEYRSTEGLEFLDKCKIPYSKIKKENV
jgi:dCMP deaminase